MAAGTSTKLTARQIMTRAAFENAIVVCFALGASTNLVLHALALAYEAGTYSHSHSHTRETSRIRTPVLHTLPLARLARLRFGVRLRRRSSNAKPGGTQKQNTKKALRIALAARADEHRKERKACNGSRLAHHAPSF